MKLLLTSNGFIGNSLEKDFLDLVGNRTNLKVAIIPTASDPIEWVPEKPGSKKEVARLIRTKNIKKGKGQDYLYFKSKGYDVVIVDLKKDPKIIKRELEKVDIIDVPGGDVNYLLNWAKKAKLNTYLKDLLAKGVIYVGTSAGTGLVTPDIGLTWWKRGMGIDHKSFGIVDFVMVVHQQEGDKTKNRKNIMKRRKYLRSVLHFPWKIYLVKDGQAVKIDGDKIEHIGPGVKKSI